MSINITVIAIHASVAFHFSICHIESYLGNSLNIHVKDWIKDKGGCKSWFKELHGQSKTFQRMTNSSG